MVYFERDYDGTWPLSSSLSPAALSQATKFLLPISSIRRCEGQIGAHALGKFWNIELASMNRSDLCDRVNDDFRICVLRT